ncbi:SAM-dependent methyltransferase, partial [Streptomyces filamentosus]
MSPAADRLARLLGHFLPGPLPVRVRAWDGSQTGPAGAPLVLLRSPDALRRLVWQPGELGLAEAYV